MKLISCRLLASGLLTVGVLALPPAARAQTWIEGGDADELVSTAQDIVGSGALMRIEGHIADNTDLFRLKISNPAIFSASVLGGTTQDTQLWLFTGMGMGIAYNDDFNSFQSALPAGNPLYANLPAGDYLLGITRFNRDPISVGGKIFPNTFSGVYGATGAGAAQPLIGWDGVPITNAANVLGGGSYAITLTGASFRQATVPEPGSIALLIGMGITSTGVLFRRQRRR